MPPRLNKRQLRELQELEDLERARAHSGAATVALPTEEEVESSGDEEEQVVSSTQGKAGGGFGAVRSLSLLYLPCWS
jgi:hypothetical protein